MQLEPALVLSTWALIVSTLAFGVSGATFLVSHVVRGRARITTPTMLYFGPDGGPNPHPKVVVRALLFAERSRGCVLEHLYVRVSRRDATHTFSTWHHGEKDFPVGGGLFIPPTGFVAYHHFMTEDRTFVFRPGTYTVEVFGQFVGERRPRLLHTGHGLEVTEAAAVQIAEHGIFFRWSSETQSYQGTVEVRPRALIASTPDLGALEALASLGQEARVKR